MRATERNGTTLDVRKIAITGVLAAIAILLGFTRLGLIPVPNASGNATIMHVPAIVGGVMEGWQVGLLIGGIFGLYSWLYATIPLFKDFRVAVIPRLFIGITSYFGYKWLKNQNEYVALVVAGVVGTLTNTILVLGMAVITQLLPATAIPAIIPQALFEIAIAVIIVVAVVTGWKRLEGRQGGSSI